MGRSGAARTPKTAPVFSALGDSTRLGLVIRLCQEGPLSIAKLSAGSEMTRQAISKHLRVLAEAGVLRSRRDGRESVWELEPQRLEQAQRHLHQISRQWDDSLLRLRALVES
ncbi:MAG: metalloregulator ArsR/SmtB family transcription factor [Polyangiaceae bacterium]